MMHPAEIQLDELIARSVSARSLDVSSRRRVHTDLAGVQLSGFRGRGMEFEEFRQYQPGDDVRNIDWRVTARTGETHSKVFREERERPVLLAVDLGQSMRFATEGAFKSVIACHAAALVGWAARHNGDRVGGLAFGLSGHAESRPAGGNRGVLHFLRCLADGHAQTAEPVGSTELGQALRRLRSVARPGSLVFLFSDLHGWDEDCRRQLYLLGQHCEVMLCRISDRIELKLPPSGRYRTQMCGNAQSEKTENSIRELDTRSTKLRREYEQQRNDFRNLLLSDSLACGAHAFEITTADEPFDRLKESLGRKNRNTQRQEEFNAPQRAFS